ncbi:MAG: hypothetical protein WAK91_19610, partial [Candidatus Acidiferrales bacterium]
NYHWAYLFCACMILLLALLAIDTIKRLGAQGLVVGRILVVAVILNAAAGVYLRGLETVRTKDSQRYSLAYQAYTRQHAAPDYRPLAAGAVTAGAEEFVQLAIIVDHTTPLAAPWPVILSPSVSNLDFDRRTALNAYLSGTSRDQFEAAEIWGLEHLQHGVELRDRAQVASRLAFFDQIASDPSAAIQRYQVKYVALPTELPRPAVLGSDWILLQPGPTWAVWEHNPPNPISQLVVR